jgi:RimJ/RimL family protein N-acetyltransferase
MIPQPVLTSHRLVLRPFALSDAQALSSMLSDSQVTRFLSDMPSPITSEVAVDWIDALPRAWNARVAVVYAVDVAEEKRLVGAVQLQLEPDQQAAELGFWIARPDWGRGFASEAVSCLLAWCFEALGLQRVHARHTADNPASGHVMAAAGMVVDPDAPHSGGAVSYQYLVSGFTQKIKNGIAMNQQPPHMNPRTARKIP